MSSASALTFGSLLLTYLLRTTAVYLVLSVLSRAIQNAHIRFRLHGLFLSVGVFAWLYVLLSLSLPGFPASGHSVGAPLSPRHLSWSLDSRLLPHIAKSFSLAGWAYAIILVLLLARFCGHFWQLTNFLRASQPPPDALSFLFELVRSKSGSPDCELRLVRGIRSPATTGWRHPKVLLPHDLLSRLRIQQLVHVFQHELMHVSRWDYLWDQLSTLGCSLIFFHPAAWWARRRLRWERELVCDEGVVQRSGEGRTEYARCLTTLAAWWFLEDNAASHVDFLSSPSSLLAARVRALMQPSSHGPPATTAVMAAATGVLIVVMLMVPKVVISSYLAPPLDLAGNQLPHFDRVPWRAKGRHGSKPRNYVAPIPARAFSQLSTPPSLNFAAPLPKLSPEAQGYSSSEPGPFESPAPSTTSAESSEYAQSARRTWDESMPRAPRRRRSKISAVALRALRLGVGLAATQIGDHEHEKAH